MRCFRSPESSNSSFRYLAMFAGLLFLTVTVLSAQQIASNLTGEWLLQSSGDDHAVLGPDGREQALPLPKNARPDRLVSAGVSWYATAIDHKDADRKEIILLQGSALGVRQLPAPNISAKEIFSPTPLTDANGLRALIWLAGDDSRSLAVQATIWKDGTWTAPQQVSPPGPGSQLALTTTRLSPPDQKGDQWLAAWAAFDGEDDEIVWSRFDGETWTAPKAVVAVDNLTPDITPQLRATSTGALLAWSRFEKGSYHVALARFDGQTWTAPVLIGEPGTLYPTFSTLPGTPMLIVRQVVPKGWRILEIDEAGTVLEQTAIETEKRDRPRVTARDSQGFELQWAGEKTEVVKRR